MKFFTVNPDRGAEISEKFVTNATVVTLRYCDSNVGGANGLALRRNLKLATAEQVVSS